MGNFILNLEESILGQGFSLSVDGKDRIHIADPENNRISVFDTNGKEISLPYSAEQSNNLNSPCGVLCLNDGSTIIGDKSEILLKHFDSNDLRVCGNETFGIPYQSSPKSNPRPWTKKNEKE